MKSSENTKSEGQLSPYLKTTKVGQSLVHPRNERCSIFLSVADSRSANTILESKILFFPEAKGRKYQNVYLKTYIIWVKYRAKELGKVTTTLYIANRSKSTTCEKSLKVITMI